MLSLIRHPKRSVVLETVATAIAIAAALYSACPSAFAGGGGPGNGGDAVYSPGVFFGYGGTWEVLDLAEAGIKTSPRFDQARKDFKKNYSKRRSSYVRGIVYETFADPRFTTSFKEALSAAIQYAGLDRANLLAAMRLYQWQLTDGKLENVGDERSTLDLSKMRVEQLAIRLDDRIQIHAPIFLEMNLLNQVALVYHEIAYALTKPITDGSGTYQPSWRARSWVASYFAVGGTHPNLASVTYTKDQYVFNAMSDVTDLVTESLSGYESDPVRIYGGQLNFVVSNDPNVSSDDLIADGDLIDAETGKWVDFSRYKIVPMVYRDREVSIKALQGYDAREVCEYVSTGLFGTGLGLTPIRIQYGWKLTPFASANGMTKIPVVTRLSNHAIGHSASTYHFLPFPSKDACAENFAQASEP
jgi:hypothetical protein